MSIIAISSEIFSVGRDIAQRTAEELGYDFLGRETLSVVASQYDVSESKLRKALEERPSLIGTSTKGWKKYLTYIEEVTLSRMLKDNVVTYGLAAHLYVVGISHVLKARIISRYGELHPQSMGHKEDSTEKARKAKEHCNRLRRQWSLKAYDRDETDPCNYDMVINLDQIDTDHAVKIIADTVQHRKFQAMTYSVKCLQDMALATRVRAVLLTDFPNAIVHCRDGRVEVEVPALKGERKQKIRQVKQLAEKVPGAEAVKVIPINDFIGQAAESFR